MTSLPDRTVDVVVVGGGARAWPRRTGCAPSTTPTSWCSRRRTAPAARSRRANRRPARRHRSGRLPLARSRSRRFRLAARPRGVGRRPAARRRLRVVARERCTRSRRAASSASPTASCRSSARWLLSPLGVARAGLDLVLPARRSATTRRSPTSRPRLGHEAFRLPSCSCCSAASTPARQERSVRAAPCRGSHRTLRALARALAAQPPQGRAEAVDSAPPLVSISGGMNGSRRARCGHRRRSACSLITTPATSLRLHGRRVDVVTPSARSPRAPWCARIAGVHD